MEKYKTETGCVSLCVSLSSLLPHAVQNKSFFSQSLQMLFLHYTCGSFRATHLRIYKCCSYRTLRSVRRTGRCECVSRLFCLFLPSVFIEGLISNTNVCLFAEMQKAAAPLQLHCMKYKKHAFCCRCHFVDCCPLPP